MRLIEYHEEIAAGRESARRYERAGHPGKARVVTGRIEAYEERIRARVAAQEIGFPFLPMTDGQASTKQERLLFGVPDAVRVYPAKRQASADGGPLTAQEVADLSAAEVAALVPEPREGWIAMTTAFPFEHWANHAAHFLPVEGCHLCREGRR